MRKLMFAATAALTALALASVATPAYADKEFTMTHPDKETPCGPYNSAYNCEDTGYVGEFYFNNTPYAWGECQAGFDMHVWEDGEIETSNEWVDCEDIPYWMYFRPHECENSPPWNGQIRIPDTGPAIVDMEICLQGSGFPLWIPVSFKVANGETGLRTWTQTENPYTYDIEKGIFEDTFAEDNVSVIFG